VDVTRGFIRIGEPAPTAYVVDQDEVEVSVRFLDVPEQSLEAGPPLQRQPAFTGVFIGPDDLDTVIICLVRNCLGLVFGGVALVLRGHADILSSTKASPSGGCFTPVRVPLH
jgi:hypothetical protein